MNDDVDDLPESIDLEPVRRDQPVEYAGRVQKLGFREGLLVAGGLIVVLAGAGVVAIGAPQPRGSAPPSNVAGGLTPPPTTPPSPEPTPRPSGTPIPTPAVTPGGACIPLSTSVGQPYVTLVTSDSQRVTGTQSPAGSWGFGEPAADAISDGMAVDVPLAEPFEILSVGLNACALEWRITFDGALLQEQHNPTMNPSVAQQGYFNFVLPATLQPSGLLRVDLHFAAGWTTSSWLLTFDPAPIPPAIVVRGAIFKTAVAACGFSIELVNGKQAQEDCSSALLPAAAAIPRLDADPGQLLALRVPHASIDDLNPGLLCGKITGTPPVFKVDVACDATLVTSSIEDYAFVAPSEIGLWVVQMNACVTREAGQVCGPWYIRIDTRHSAAASASPGPSASDPGGAVP